MKKREVLAWFSCIICLGAVLTSVGLNGNSGDSSILVSADTRVLLVHMSKAQMMFTQVVTPIDPETEKITYDQINMTIAGVVPPNVNRTLVENEDRVLIMEVLQLNIDCLFVDPYSLNISIGVHVRTWNGTTESWNPISVDYQLWEHRAEDFSMSEMTVNQISNRRAVVTINMVLSMYISMSDILWDLGGEYGIQIGAFIRIDGEMIRFGDIVSAETPVKNFEVSAP